MLTKWKTLKNVKCDRNKKGKKRFLHLCLEVRQIEQAGVLELNLRQSFDEFPHIQKYGQIT